MNEFLKTGIAVGAAVGFAMLAMVVKPGEARLDLFDDQGEEFFANFTDPAAVAELKVTLFRSKTTDVGGFSVKRDDNDLWVIPSHGNYPADATEEMGKSATMFIGLRKQKVVGDQRERHKEYGVVDPLAPGVQTEGRGKRVEMKDKAGNALADLIVGDKVEGKQDTYYVRLPEKRRVYTAQLSGKLSTSFADWIETDLLKAASANISKVTFDNYAVREQGLNITLQEGDKFVLSRGVDNKWTFDGLDATKEQTNQTKANEIASALADIKIVGVRTKPEGLTARLERANGFEAAVLKQQLTSKGFFFSGGRLYSNEGDLLFETKSGVRYTLRFGTLVAGEGEELTAGVGGGDDAAKPEGEAKNRYLMVTVDFDESLLDKPAAARLADEELQKRKQARTDIEQLQQAIAQFRVANDGKLPESLAKLTEKPEEGDALVAELKKDPWGADYAYQQTGEGFVVMSHAADGAAGGTEAGQDVRSDQLPLEDALAKAATDWQVFDSKVATGQKEAADLTSRFGQWYYVIDQELFAKLKPARADLVEPKAEEGQQPPK